MRQINVRVEEEIGQAFYEFCANQGITPYKLLGSIVGFYGRGEMLTRKQKEKAISEEEALIELGRIVDDMQRFAKANGEFLEAIAVLLKPHGVKLSSLWPIQKGSGKKTPT
jgi:hypothetical protein